MDNEFSRQKAYEEGKNRMETALCDYELEDAASLLEKAGDYADAPELLKVCRERIAGVQTENKYRAACVMLKNARSENGCLMAKELLDELGDYMDAREKAQECLDKAGICRKEEIYQDALNHMNRAGDDAADLAAAADLFGQLEAYRDSAALQERSLEMKREAEVRTAEKQERERKRKEKRAKQIRHLKRACIITPVAALLIVGMILLHVFYLVPEKKYKQAASLVTEGRYAEAYDIYMQIPEYKDVRSILRSDEGLYHVWKTRFLDSVRRPGSTVTFGVYEQDNKPANGPEDIEWIVLEYDEDTDRALLYSSRVLDCRRFNDAYETTSWEKCTLRAWLNGEFFGKAFGEAAFGGRLTDAVPVVTVDNSAAQNDSRYGSTGGNNTRDRVFLLSYGELMRCIPDAKNRMCEPTEYAREHETGGHSEYYLLRTPGLFGDYAGSVFSDGMSTGTVAGGRRGVRPAVWVDLKVLEDGSAE